MDMIHNILSNRIFNRYAVLYATIIAALILSITIATITWHIYEDYQNKKADYLIQPPAVNNQPIKTYRINDIVSAHLFGDPTVVKQLVKHAPETTLDLTLQGILSADNPETARAIIAVSKGKGKLYHIGEKIEKTNVEIKQINTHEVLLNRNGSIESLPLIKKSSSGNRSIVAYNETNSNNDNLQSTAPQKTAPAPPRTATPRAIKRPNPQSFKGLDKALEKIGEL